MNIRSLLGGSRGATRATGLDATGTSSKATAGPSAAMTLMTCEDCELSGGPFTAAEAAHLRAVHDRLFHGVSSAA